MFQILREVPSFDVTYTCIVIAHNGRMVFTGTSAGTIRSMKYPLPVHKEFNEYQAHAGSVTKVKSLHYLDCLSFSGIFLFFFFHLK